MSKIRNATFLRALNISIALVSGRIIIFAILITYVFQGNALNADKVFVVMSVVNTVVSASIFCENQKTTFLFLASYNDMAFSKLNCPSF